MGKTKRLPIRRRIERAACKPYAADTLLRMRHIPKSSLHRQICMVQAAFICRIVLK
ncbi:hypothetical protein HMPREF9098_0887 [Kingella denitrificans ATCC 33394]|uniref:Uncharacterized protein n=1 Tax=Kingella denitrificans ATCC 33394 TaxID=888741 RepID=F0EYF3_9NEIS|nr:hypothetical protein HMPREF9098_0887 [Kingella denitrificans ATCC 33394]